MGKDSKMIRLEDVHKSFGDLEVLKGINLHVKEGEKLVIIGPSGSGKSTLIRCMNYLEEPTSGKVYVHNHLMSRKRRAFINKVHSSMVFQQFNLYPHLTVLENLTLAPMKLKKVPKSEAEQTAMTYLKRVGLEENLIKNTSCMFLAGGAVDLISRTNAFAVGEGTGSAAGQGYIIGGVIFFVICFPLSMLASRWEKKLKARDVATVTVRKKPDDVTDAELDMIISGKGGEH